MGCGKASSCFPLRLNVSSGEVRMLQHGTPQPPCSWLLTFPMSPSCIYQELLGQPETCQWWASLSGIQTLLQSCMLSLTTIHAPPGPCLLRPAGLASPGWPSPSPESSCLSRPGPLMLHKLTAGAKGEEAESWLYILLKGARNSHLPKTAFEGYFRLSNLIFRLFVTLFACIFVHSFSQLELLIWWLERKTPLSRT